MSTVDWLWEYWSISIYYLWHWHIKSFNKWNANASQYHFVGKWKQQWNQSVQINRFDSHTQTHIRCPNRIFVIIEVSRDASHFLFVLIQNRYFGIRHSQILILFLLSILLLIQIIRLWSLHWKIQIVIDPGKSLSKSMQMSYESMLTLGVHIELVERGYAECRAGSTSNQEEFSKSYQFIKQKHCATIFENIVEFKSP